MEKTIVYVVTDVELGWDCVRGVFSSIDSLVNYINERYDEKDQLSASSLHEVEDFLDKKKPTWVIHKEIVQ